MRKVDKMNPQEDLSCWNDELASQQADEIIEIFKNIKRTLGCKFEKIAKQYGFTAPQLGVIFHLYETPSITLNELSEHMMLTKSTVSGIIDRLTKQGVVIRKIPENNRRTVILSLSKEFRENNDICKMKKNFISDLISNSIKEVEPAEVEKIIYGLRQFSLLLSNNDCK
jgi:DNA-binding MarR family transcriptional regulator